MDPGPPCDLTALFAPIARARTEVAAFAYLDRDRRLLGVRHSPSTSGCRVEVSIRAVARDALAFGAAAVVMAHNHPSGDPTPSAHDLEVTRRLSRTLEALEVPLVEHLIFAGDRVTSLREAGIL